MSKKKFVLYVWFESFGEYLPAQAVRCDMCNKIFKVSKGFALSEDGYMIICHKHLNEENLINEQKSNVT